MLDEFDYKEPVCPLCDGKDFYYPKKDGPLGHIPVDRIISKVDSLFDKNDYTEAGRLLVYWENEAKALRDKHGELAIESELIGFYRKQNNKEKGLKSVERALVLIEELNQDGTVSGATILLNCATAYKAFGMAQKAMPLYLCTEEIYKKSLQENDSRFGGLYNNMALALADLGKFQEAENSYFSALRVMEKAPHGEAECAITYINLAHMYDDFSVNDKIKECMEKAYALLKSDNLIHDGYYAFVLEKCAPSFAYFGNKAICEEMKQEARSIYARN